MSYTPTEWVNEVLNGTTPKYLVKDDAGNIVYNAAEISVINTAVPGTPVNATNLNKIENGLQAAAAVADGVSGTAAAAQATADTALANAAAAQTTANGAVTNAAAAQTTANAAVPKSTVTTAGDIIVASGAAAVTRLARGSHSGMTLSMSGTSLAWSLAIGAIVFNIDSYTTAPENAITNVSSYSTTIYNTNSFYSSGKITIPSGYDGIYAITCEGWWEAGDYGYRQIGPCFNSNTYAWVTTPPISDVALHMCYSGFHKLNVGDTVEMAVLQGGGGNLPFHDARLAVLLHR